MHGMRTRKHHHAHYGVSQNLMMTRSLLCPLLFLAAVPLIAEEAPSSTPGHSLHGESFNEGPRQQAYLMNTTGEVDFPITTAHEDAQAFFNQGVGQLHGFWYFEAERSFRQVLHIDPTCQMAYWGLAMSTPYALSLRGLFLVLCYFTLRWLGPNRSYGIESAMRWVCD